MSEKWNITDFILIYINLAFQICVNLALKLLLLYIFVLLL